MKTEEEIEKEKKEEKIKLIKMIFAFLGVGAIVFSMPYFFTQFSWGIDYTEKGGIGDTIGGITAPFINLIAAFLIYYSFNEQVKANRIQVKSIEEAKITNRDNQLADQIVNRDTQLINIIFEDSKTILNMIDSYEISKGYINEVSREEKVTKSYFGIEGVLCFYGSIIENKDFVASDVFFPKEISSMQLLNNSIGVLLTQIWEISDQSIKKIYFERYYFQIHSLFYSQFKREEAKFDLKSDSAFYGVWDISQKNNELFKEMKRIIEGLKKEESVS